MFLVIVSEHTPYFRVLKYLILYLPNLLIKYLLNRCRCDSVQTRKIIDSYLNARITTGKVKYYRYKITYYSYYITQEPKINKILRSNAAWGDWQPRN